MDSRLVTISIHKKKRHQFFAKLDINQINYNQFGYLDLNEAERLQFKNTIKANASEENIPLKIESKYLILDHVNHKLSIRRINELQPEQIDMKEIDFLNAVSDTDRIHFSTKSPLMAKYRGELYFVHKKLEKEYLELLYHTKQKRGTAIRVNINRVTISDGKLSVNKVNDYAGKEIAVIKVPETFENHLRENILKITENCEYNRYMVGYYGRQKVLHRVDPFLIHSSKYDICTDIHAEVDYADLYLMAESDSDESDSTDDFDDE